MYSALVKVSRAFLHSVAMLIFAVLMVALTAAALQVPIEIADAFGSAWAHHVIAYFWDGGQ
jgi:hypothetical protein